MSVQMWRVHDSDGLIGYVAYNDTGDQWLSWGAYRSESRDRDDGDLMGEQDCGHSDHHLVDVVASFYGDYENLKWCHECKCCVWPPYDGRYHGYDCAAFVDVAWKTGEDCDCGAWDE